MLPIPISVCGVSVCPNNNTAVSARDFFMCTQKWLHATAQRVCTNSWLWEKNPLPHWGLGPASILHLAFQSLYQMSHSHPSEQKKLAHYLFGTFATHSGLVHGVTNTDCLPQNDSTHGCFQDFQQQFSTHRGINTEWKIAGDLLICFHLKKKLHSAFDRAHDVSSL